MRANRDVLGSVVAASVIAVCVFGGARQIYMAAMHEGPGVVSYEYHSEWESQSRYRTHNYIGGGLLLIVGAVLGVSWFNHCRRSTATA